MKLAEVQSSTKTFVPFEVTLLMESTSDVAAIYALFNSTNLSTCFKNIGVPAGITVPTSICNAQGFDAVAGILLAHL